MSERQEPGPIPGPTMPNPAQLAAVRDRTLIEQLMVLGAASGPIFQLPGGPPRNIAVWGFPLIDELSDDKRFDKALGAGLLAVRAYAGDGLFTAFTDEPNWGKAHRILMPAFSQSAMEMYHDAMTELGSQLVLKWERL